MKKTLLFICCLFLQYAFCQQSWTLIQAGEDIYNGQLNGGEWPNRWDIESLDMKPVPGGFLTCGHYNDQIFDSTNGNTYDLTNKYGAYLAKYNNDGVLQWLVHTEKAESEERNLIMSIATDSQNNIYIIGKSDGDLYDTTGDVQAVSPQNPVGGSNAFLMKFNENGEFIWKTFVLGADPKRVAIDKEDNVVVVGAFWGHDSGHMLFNDQYVGIWTDITDTEVHYYIAKYASDGMPLWDAGILIDSVNDEFVEGVTFDNDNNIYVNGVYEMDLKVYDENEQDYIQRDWSGHYGGSMFLAKYTPDGDAQWVINSDDSKLTKIITNPDGSHYITGNNSVVNGQWFQLMMNADETTLTQNVYGPYYVAKINADGTWGWLTGSTGTTYGYGIEMLKYDDKISIFGLFNDAHISAGTLHSVDDSVEVNIDTADPFIATYTLDGNLFSVSKSRDVPDGYYIAGTSGFIRDEDGFFYMQRNLMGFEDNSPREFYGQMIAPINGGDATITKFKETDGQMLYLSVDEMSDSKVCLAPNPTDKEFVVSMGKTYGDATLIVTDISGKKVFEKSYSNVNSMPAEITGSTGIYFVKISAGNEVQHFKILKK